MRSLSAEITTHIAGDVTTLATCWRVKQRSGTESGFTSHDKDIIFGAITYTASTGFTPTAVASSSDLSVDNLDVEAILDSNGISEQDIVAGKYDFAAIEIFLVNYADLTQGKIALRNGWIGEVTLENGKFTAEMRGLTEKLSHIIGDIYSPSCRVDLGDTKCGVNLSTSTISSTVTSVTDRRIFTDSVRAEANGHFNQGKLTFTSGNNNTLSMEVKSFLNKQIELVLPMPYDIQVSDGYDMELGCDKSFETCRDKFSNTINFRGEPHVPGMDKILQTASTRS